MAQLLGGGVGIVCLIPYGDHVTFADSAMDCRGICSVECHGNAGVRPKDVSQILSYDKSILFHCKGGFDVERFFAACDFVKLRVNNFFTQILDSRGFNDK